MRHRARQNTIRSTPRQDDETTRRDNHPRILHHDHRRPREHDARRTGRQSHQGRAHRRGGSHALHWRPQGRYFVIVRWLQPGQGIDQSRPQKRGRASRHPRDDSAHRCRDPQLSARHHGDAQPRFQNAGATQLAAHLYGDLRVRHRGPTAARTRLRPHYSGTVRHGGDTRL